MNMNEEVNTEWLIDNGEPLPPTDDTQLSSELNMLVDLAKNVGLYDYNYTDEANADPNLPGADGQEHIGIMAQQLLNVPGLSSAVSTTVDENGQETYVVDGVKVALASLGYIAALTKIVLDIRGIKYNDDTSTDNASTVSTSGEAEGNEAIGTTETGTEGYEESINSNGPAVQATGSTGIDNTASGLNSSVYESVVANGVGK